MSHRHNISCRVLHINTTCRYYAVLVHYKAIYESVIGRSYASECSETAWLRVFWVMGGGYLLKSCLRGRILQLIIQKGSQEIGGTCLFVQVAVVVVGFLDQLHRGLGGELYFLPVTLLQRVTQDSLAVAGLIRIGRIDVVYPFVDGVADNPYRLVLINVASPFLDLSFIADDGPFGGRKSHDSEA